MTSAPSAVDHAFNVVVRALPCAPIVSASCMYASSLGASAIAYHTSIFAPTFAASAFTASTCFVESFTFRMPGPSFGVFESVRPS